MTFQADPGHLFSSPRIKLRSEWLIHIDGAGAGARGIRAEGWKLGWILVGHPYILIGDGTRRPVYRFGNNPLTYPTLR